MAFRLAAFLCNRSTEVPLRFIDALRYAPDIVRSQPRTASLLSGNSVLRTDFLQRSEADSAAAGRNAGQADLMGPACPVSEGDA